jgi:hypothetical protein
VTDARELLGPAVVIWDGIVQALQADHGELEPDWKPSKSDFGSMCALKLGKRTVVYLTPETDAVLVAVVLGERATTAALAGRLPEAVKTLLREARPYAEGRGIRLRATKVADVKVVRELVSLKLSRA